MERIEEERVESERVKEERGNDQKGDETGLRKRKVRGRRKKRHPETALPDMQCSCFSFHINIFLGKLKEGHIDFPWK